MKKKYFNEVLDEYCGFTQFNYEKMVNMILFFALKFNRLFKTKTYEIIILL